MLEISGIGVLTAFAAGMISFLSPCVLPLVPDAAHFPRVRADRMKTLPASDRPRMPTASGSAVLARHRALPSLETTR
jgi:cytochrome c biogenesis protein CcdA